jgi:TonB family protein
MVADDQVVHPGDVPRRRMTSAVLSLVVHGGLVVLAIELVHGSAAPPRSGRVERTEIEVVAPPPVRPTGRGPVARTSAGAPAGIPGRRSRDAAPRSQTHAPASPFAELAIHMEAPPDVDPGAAAPDGVGRGTGVLGAGLGAGGTGGGFGDGLGGLGVPSLARGAVPKHDYRRWRFRTARRFAGSVVLVELAIDPRGAVRAVRVAKAVDPAIDDYAVETARHFEFYPALDAGGEPIWSHYGWQFLVVNDDAQSSVFSR